MGGKVVRFADVQARKPASPASPPRKSGGRPRLRDTDVEGFSVVVEVQPPDLVTVTMTHGLWSLMADWLAAQRVRFTIVPPEQPGRRPGSRRPGRETNPP